MNTTDLLRATFAEHEKDAPDVTETRLGIEDRIAHPARRRPLVLGTVAASATVLAIVSAPGVIHALDSSGSHAGAPATPTTSTRPGHRPGTTTAPPSGAERFPFRAGWLPPGADFNHSETGRSRYHLEDWTFGTTPSQQRGLTLWSESGRLPGRLRDGGRLHPTEVAGRPAVEGWSPSSRSYTVAVRRPHGIVVSVLAYGWNRRTASTYARRTARALRYGHFAPPA